jgi:hypothetical protein
MLRFSSLVAVLSLVGCAHSPKGGEQDAPNPHVLAELQSIHPTSTESGVLVLYRNTTFGGLFGPVTFKGSLYLDDQAIGDLSDDTYNLLELKPGRHSLRVLGVAPGIVVPLQATTVISVGAGSSQFIQLETEQGFSNVGVQFKTVIAPPLSDIARDCHKGFSLNLAAEDAPKPHGPTSKL